MCGILAVVDFNNRKIDPELVARMRDTMYHRGPDDADVYIDGPIGLAHRRLSIIDLSGAGRQPMTNEDGSIVIVFNGEIYNYVELRENLLRKGHRFHSTSDTEVIIHQYEEDGEHCLGKFNGMFSLVLWDAKKQRVFAARDRLGIKPLYYYVDRQKIILASEVKAIIEDPGVPRVPDHQAIADYFFAGRTLGNKTMFHDIKEVEPGYMLNVDVKTRQVNVKKYWDVVYDYNYSRTDEQVREELLSLLDDAVRIHCRSDASLGCHLSGGLDSSTIVALAAKYRKPLHTFSVKFSDDMFIDETLYAKTVASHVGAEYHESSPSSLDLARLLPFLVWHMDVPMINPGGFAYFTASDLARKHVKVSLTGHGGDELFAGYPAQFSASYKNTDMFELHRDPDMDAEVPPWGTRIQGLLRKGPRGVYQAIRSKLSLKGQSLDELWVQLHCGIQAKDNPIFASDFTQGLQGYSSRDDYIRPFSDVMSAQTLDKCLYHDLRLYLPALLHMEDRVSMSVSIESRVPLLDYRIVEFLATVPPEQKINGLQPKHLLRQVASTMLPERIWQRRDKRPFPIPGRFWKSREMKETTARILLSSESLKRGIIKPEILKDSGNSLGLLWSIVNMELWFKLFIDRDASWMSRIRL